MHTNHYSNLTQDTENLSIENVRTVTPYSTPMDFTCDVTETKRTYRCDNSWLSWASLKKLVAATNGLLYVTVANAGGQNLKHFLGFNSEVAISVLSGFAGVCNALFYYKILEYLKLKPTTVLTTLLAGLSPISASAFLTAGIEGSAGIPGFSTKIDIAVGVSIYILRMIACVDGAVKLPGRMEELKSAWNTAWSEKDFKELSRLIATGLVSVGYSLSSTDAIYEASEIILNWFGVPTGTQTAVSYAAGTLGGIGIFPLVLYWTHRGIKQLTWGGRANDTGANPDPTDRYTFLSLLPVTPVTLGIVGASSSEVGELFGKLGWSAEIVRLMSSSIYSIAGGVPGMSTLLRSIADTINPQTALTCLPCSATGAPAAHETYASFEPSV
jgi:hypothetical protein